MHPSGFFEVLVTSLKDLEGLDPKTQAVRIGATVGTRKRTIIQDQALTAGLRVLNAKVVKTVKAKPAKAEPAKKDESEVKAKKKAPVKAKPAAPAKKTAAKPKAEKTEETVEKKAPAKKTAAKPKAEKSGVKKNE
jgi:large subunit ribosomal protein L32e